VGTSISVIISTLGDPPVTRKTCSEVEFVDVAGAIGPARDGLLVVGLQDDRADEPLVPDDAPAEHRRVERGEPVGACRRGADGDRVPFRRASGRRDRRRPGTEIGGGAAAGEPPFAVAREAGGRLLVAVAVLAAGGVAGVRDHAAS
jgi:hypothetical protein